MQVICFILCVFVLLQCDNHFGFLYMVCTMTPPENTTEPSMCGGDAALCQITLTTCYHYYLIRLQLNDYDAL